MSPGDIPAWLPYVNSFGLVMIALFLVYAFISRRVVTKGELEEAQKDKAETRQDLEDMRRDRDDWKAIAQRGTNQAETSTKSLLDMINLIRAVESERRPMGNKA